MSEWFASSVAAGEDEVEDEDSTLRRQLNQLHAYRLKLAAPIGTSGHDSSQGGATPASGLGRQVPPAMGASVPAFGRRVTLVSRLGGLSAGEGGRGGGIQRRSRTESESEDEEDGGGGLLVRKGGRLRQTLGRGGGAARWKGHEEGKSSVRAPRPPSAYQLALLRFGAAEAPMSLSDMESGLPQTGAVIGPQPSSGLSPPQRLSNEGIRDGAPIFEQDM